MSSRGDLSCRSYGTRPVTGHGPYRPSFGHPVHATHGGTTALKPLPTGGSTALGQYPRGDSSSTALGHSDITHGGRQQFDSTGRQQFDGSGTPPDPSGGLQGGIARGQDLDSNPRQRPSRSAASARRSGCSTCRSGSSRTTCRPGSRCAARDASASGIRTRQRSGRRSRCGTWRGPRTWSGS